MTFCRLHPGNADCGCVPAALYCDCGHSFASHGYNETGGYMGCKGEQHTCPCDGFRNTSTYLQADGRTIVEASKMPNCKALGCPFQAMSISPYCPIHEAAHANLERDLQLAKDAAVVRTMKILDAYSRPGYYWFVMPPKPGKSEPHRLYMRSGKSFEGVDHQDARAQAAQWLITEYPNLLKEESSPTDVDCARLPSSEPTTAKDEQHGKDGNGSGEK